MIVEPIAVTVQCWRNSENDTLCIKVMRLDTAESVPLQAGMFVVRFVPGSSGNLQRCLIRHTSSGRETYMQGGENLQAFVLGCVLEEGVTANALPTLEDDHNENDERGENGRLPGNRGDL